MIHFIPKMHNIYWISAVAPPRPCWESSQRSPDPSWIWGRGVHGNGIPMNPMGMGVAFGLLVGMGLM